MTQRILYWNVSNYVGTGYNYQHSRAFIYHPPRNPPPPTYLPYPHPSPLSSVVKAQFITAKTERKTDRQTETETGRLTETETNRQRQTDREDRDRQTDRDRDTEKETERQTQTDRQTETETETDIYFKH